MNWLSQIREERKPCPEHHGVNQQAVLVDKVRRHKTPRKSGSWEKWILGTDETYPIKTGPSAKSCASLIGVLFVCPRSLPISMLRQATPAEARC
jgi:hypothetical protein